MRAYPEPLSLIHISRVDDAGNRERRPHGRAEELEHCLLYTSHVALTGGTALRYYKRLLAEEVGLPYQGFPSTSPANARWRLPELVEAYKPLREWAESGE